MNIEREGVVRLFADVKVAVEEIGQWSPERITAFMNGLAQVQAAANPNNWTDHDAADREQTV